MKSWADRAVHYFLYFIFFIFPAIQAGRDIVFGDWTAAPYTVWKHYYELFSMFAFVILYIWPSRFLFEHSVRVDSGSSGEKVCRLLSYTWFSTAIGYVTTESIAWHWKGIQLDGLSLLLLTAAELAVFAGVYMLARGFGWPEYHYLTTTLPLDIRQGKVFPWPESKSEGKDAEIGDTEDKTKVVDGMAGNGTVYANEKLDASQ